MINVDISNIWGELSLPDLLSIEQEVSAAHAALMEGNFPGAEFRGWLDLPSTEELQKIRKAADSIRAESDVCVVLGLGGGCLGAKAAVELLQGPHRNLGKGRGDPQLFFAGNSLSTRQWNELKRLLEGKDFSVIVISRSGTDLEPAIAFRGLRWILERKYGTDESNRRIFAISDPAEGALAQMAAENGWERFDIPENVSDPYAVLTPAGLLPMAAAGLNIEELLLGAREAKECYDLRSFENPVWLYAAVRNLMLRRGKAMELLASWEPGFQTLERWWQQLFGSSEGKDGKGLFPVTAEYPADLHALGQLIAEGQRNLFETLIRFEPAEQSHIIGYDALNRDGLNILADRTLDFVEENAYFAALNTHADSGVPVITMECGPLTKRSLGELFFFLQLSCAVSACTLGVDPFGLPGAELYRASLAQQPGMQ